MQDKKYKLKQWLWFIGLYLGSVIAFTAVTFLLKSLIPH